MKELKYSPGSQNPKFKAIAPDGKITDDTNVLKHKELLNEFLVKAEEFVNENKETYFEIRSFYPEVLSKKLEYTSGLTSLIPLSAIFIIFFIAGVLGAGYLLMRLAYIYLGLFNTPGFYHIFNVRQYQIIALTSCFFYGLTPFFKRHFLSTKMQKLKQNYQELSALSNSLNDAVSKFLDSFNDFSPYYSLEDDKYLTQKTIKVMKNLVDEDKSKTWKDILDYCDNHFNYSNEDGYELTRIEKATEDFSIIMMAVLINKVSDLNQALIKLNIDVSFDND